MTSSRFFIACHCLCLLSGCLDFIDVKTLPLVIDYKYLSPNPTLLTETIGVGKNCNGVVFTVPPIKGLSQNDRLYYLWFLDNRLVKPQAFIKAESRNFAITFRLDHHFLLSHFESKIPNDFFNRPHVIEILVSDMEYTIPESRYQADAKKNEDYAYWIISFNNDPC
jgi:hypothetical protein